MARSAEIDASTSDIVESTLQPFLQSEFDPATYLNSTLPALSSGSNSTSRTTRDNGSLTEVSLQAQTLLSKLSSQTTRLSNNLTQITDEIVRSGGRLAYEVELLRGEAIGLSDALNNDLKETLDVFVKQENGQSAENDTKAEDAVGTSDIPLSQSSNGQPQYLARLHTLTSVRGRLDAVIKMFDEAMKWPIAPVDTSSSLIALTAPTTADEARSLEAKAKEYMDALRQEINNLLSSGEQEAAVARVDGLRAIADVWHGTAEEKARLKVVEEMQRLVDEQRKPSNITSEPTVGKDYRYGGLSTKAIGDSGYGFLNNLRNLKNEVYLD